MVLGKVFQAFVERRPIAVMTRGVLERLLDANTIDALFERTSQVQYTRELLFSTTIDLMSQVVLGTQPSVHAAYRAREEEIGVSITSVYNKLDGIEPNVSAELVRYSATAATPVIHRMGGTLPALFGGYHTKILDGNHFSATEHRIEELRTTSAAPLPGKALVVLDPELMLAIDVFPCEDGHAQERSLLDSILPTVRLNDLWIADRNFCTRRFLFGIAACSAKFLIRQHGTLKGELLGKRKRRGRCDTGEVYEQKLQLFHPNTDEVMTVRRITILLDEPTRDGETELHLLSNIPVRKASAIKLATLYQKRWSIEIMFNELTMTLTCEINTLGYPKAALFAFCLALLAYNSISLTKAALRAIHGEEAVHNLSGYYLALEISQTYDGMMIAIPTPKWAVFRKMTLNEFADVLKQLAGKVKLKRYRKHKRGPKKKPPRRTDYTNGGHVSTARLIGNR